MSQVSDSMSEMGVLPAVKDMTESEEEVEARPWKEQHCCQICFCTVVFMIIQRALNHLWSYRQRRLPR